MERAPALVFACVALLFSACRDVVKLEGEWERMNRDVGDVVAPSVMNEYSVVFDDGRMLSAWTGIRGDQTVLQVAIVESGSELSEVERYVLDAQEGILFSPRIVPGETESVLAWLLRRKVDGAVVYDIQVCTLDNTGRFSAVETLGNSAGIQRFELVKTQQGELLVGSVASEVSDGRKLLVFLREKGQWNACRLGNDEEWLGDQPQISVGPTSLALAWMFEGEIQVAHSRDGRSWERSQVEGPAEGVLGQMGAIGEEHWIALMDEDPTQPIVEIRLLKSSLKGSKWASELEKLQVEGRRVSIPFGRSVGEAVLLAIWRADTSRGCQRIDAARYGGNWEVLPVNGPADDCLQSQVPSVVESGDTTLFAWQEWKGASGSVKLASVSGELGLWPEAPLLVEDDGPEVAYSAPKLVAAGERGALLCFSYEPTTGPMQRSTKRGNLVARRWVHGIDLGF